MTPPDDDELPDGPQTQRHPPPGGKHRGKADTARIMEKIETAMLYGAERRQITKAMEDENVSLRSVDDYMRKIRQRWVDEEEVNRPFTKAQQIIRIFSQIRKLSTDEGKKKFSDREIYKRERLLAQIQGNLAPVIVNTIIRGMLDALSPEQVEYMCKNDGRLPPGVTAEQLMGKKPA